MYLSNEPEHPLADLLAQSIAHVADMHNDTCDLSIQAHRHPPLRRFGHVTPDVNYLVPSNAVIVLDLEEGVRAFTESQVRWTRCSQARRWRGDRDEGTGAISKLDTDPGAQRRSRSPTRRYPRRGADRSSAFVGDQEAGIENQARAHAEGLSRYEPDERFVRSAAPRGVRTALSGRRRA
jgi:hypothetical protein